MKSEWTKVSLLSVCSRLSSGKSISSKLLKEKGVIPVYGGNGVRGYIEEGENFNGEYAIIGRQGAYCGNVRFFSGKAYMTEHAIVAQANACADTRFLAYKLSLMQLGRLSGQSAQPGLSVKVLGEQVIDIPPLPTQRKIASILSALDDKIEINNAICRNLEEQAEAIFSQYYQKENEPRLFTSVIQISGGGTPKTSEPSFWNGNIPFFTPKDAESPFAFTTEKTLTEEGLNNCSSILYPEWTTFITARGTVGKISLAGRAMAMNQSCYALISEEIHPLLIYFYALVVVKSLKQKASGAVFDAIVTRDFDREEIKLLKKDEQQLLLMRIEPIYTQIRSLKLENLKLAETRSALISKLMSGELAVESIN